jgi:hypothetical protein
MTISTIKAHFDLSSFDAHMNPEEYSDRVMTALAYEYPKASIMVTWSTSTSGSGYVDLRDSNGKPVWEADLLDPVMDTLYRVRKQGKWFVPAT